LHDMRWMYLRLRTIASVSDVYLFKPQQKSKSKITNNMNQEA
jgi:hypothetical protein